MHDHFQSQFITERVVATVFACASPAASENITAKTGSTLHRMEEISDTGAMGSFSTGHRIRIAFSFVIVSVSAILRKLNWPGRLDASEY